jgi:chromosome segregation ATPase
MKRKFLPVLNPKNHGLFTNLEECCNNVRYIKDWTDQHSKHTELRCDSVSLQQTIDTQQEKLTESQRNCLQLQSDLNEIKQSQHERDESNRSRESYYQNQQELFQITTKQYNEAVQKLYHYDSNQSKLEDTQRELDRARSLLDVHLQSLMSMIIS